jgi:hypothetical protein
MDWIFEKQDKSLATNAKRIVADMHKHLDREKQRNKELEVMILRFQHLCTESLESELRRLDLRKSDILAELETIDRQILEKRTILDRTRDEVREILSHAATATAKDHEHTAHRMGDMDHHVIENGKGSSLGRLDNNSSTESLSPLNHRDAPSSSIKPDGYQLHAASGHADSQSIEQQYVEEEELVDECRGIVQNFLFMIHQSNARDIISYSLQSNPRKLEFIEVLKVVNLAAHPSIGPLSEKDQALFDGKIIPNHDRDFPEVRDLEVPAFMLPEKLRAKRSLVTFGSLVGAFEVPIVPEVLVDVWRYVPISDDSSLVTHGEAKPADDNIGVGTKIWATTSIDNVNFAILERIFITVEVAWGSQNILQIDLFGRHPKTGRLLLESIVPS